MSSGVFPPPPHQHSWQPGPACATDYNVRGEYSQEYPPGSIIGTTVVSIWLVCACGVVKIVDADAT